MKRLPGELAFYLIIIIVAMAFACVMKLWLHA